jgi:hypothetical protein
MRLLSTIELLFPNGIFKRGGSKFTIYRHFLIDLSQDLEVVEEKEKFRSSSFFLLFNSMTLKHHPSECNWSIVIIYWTLKVTWRSKIGTSIQGQIHFIQHILLIITQFGFQKKNIWLLRANSKKKEEIRNLPSSLLETQLHYFNISSAIDEIQNFTRCSCKKELLISSDKMGIILNLI